MESERDMSFVLLNILQEEYGTVVTEYGTAVTGYGTAVTEYGTVVTEPPSCFC